MEKLDAVKKKLILMKDRKESLEIVAVMSGVSRRTLTNIMNDNGVQSQTVLKIWSYFESLKKGKK